MNNLTFNVKKYDDGKIAITSIVDKTGDVMAAMQDGKIDLSVVKNRVGEVVSVYVNGELKTITTLEDVRHVETEEYTGWLLDFKVNLLD